MEFYLSIPADAVRDFYDNSCIGKLGKLRKIGRRKKEKAKGKEGREGKKERRERRKITAVLKMNGKDHDGRCL
jgi:hypothetical protein